MASPAGTLYCNANTAATASRALATLNCWRPSFRESTAPFCLVTGSYANFTRQVHKIRPGNAAVPTNAGPKPVIPDSSTLTFGEAPGMAVLQRLDGNSCFHNPVRRLRFPTFGFTSYLLAQTCAQLWRRRPRRSSPGSARGDLSANSRSIVPPRRSRHRPAHCAHNPASASRNFSVKLASCAGNSIFLGALP